jgi:catechol 2,3-dioxygenase-like lactoylglutathione lyase family enzyme
MRRHLRIAKPVADLERSVPMYRDGLGLCVIARFTDHDGFDGVMMGSDGMDYHLEFTCGRRHAVRPSPAPEDLLVFYIPEPEAWRHACARMDAAGFQAVSSFNPYWDRSGRTFEDPDGYRVVLQNATWTNRPAPETGLA